MSKPFVKPEITVTKFEQDVLTGSGEGTAKDMTWKSEDALKNLWGGVEE